MAARYQVMSVKLDRDLRSKLLALAQMRHRSPHALMKEAIARYIWREEMGLWTKYLDEHKTIAPELAAHAASLLDAPPSGLPERIKKQIADGHNRLRVLRGWRGMTMERLAAALRELGADIPMGMLEEIEEDRFRPDAGLTVLLAKVLDVSTEDVAG